MKWKAQYTLWLIGAIAAVVLLTWLVQSVKQTEVSIDVDEQINVTPEQIESIKAIGEWEFLAIADEELVDTVRKGIFSDDHLVRIYYGTVRLGINMHQAKPHWLTAQGDTVTAILPKVGLLDKDFIDEARTKSFYESGRWTPQDREALYRKAYRQMLRRCLTKANLQTAQENAEAQFGKMLRSLGYKEAVIRFEN